MKTLLQIYNDISENKNLYDYYGSNLILKDAWINVKSAHSFIQQYFQNGEKAIFELKICRDMYQPDIRDIHTVSVFILGIEIARKMKNRILGNELFIWFLMCLYHDMGYKLENKTDLVKEYYTLDKFLQKNEIKEEYNIFKVYKKKTLCENYYRYRAEDRYRTTEHGVIKEHGVIDHGIAGGIILYKVLVKNYEMVKRKSENNKDSFEYNNLIFSTDNFKDYAKAAIGIIRHNMWYANKSDDCKTYYEFGLDDLISEPQNKICYTDDRLLFLLCLADTIEPLKRFRNLGTNEEINEILRQICMDIENISNQKNSKITITIQVSDKLEDKVKNELIKNCRSLDSWMNVKTTQEDNKVKITFSFQNKSIDDLKLKISERAVR